jgi:hypothetical protein
MFRCSSELTLKEVLSDSIVRAVMAADGVDPQELEAALEEVARTRNRRANVATRAPTRGSNAGV